MAFDFKLFQLINGLVGRIALLDAAMRLFVNDYFVPTTMSLLLVALWFSGQERNQRAAIQAAVALGLTNVVVKAINLVYFRPRPFATQDVNLLFYRPTDPSMPSNPAAVGFSFATAVWLHNRLVGAIMYVLAALFAFARVYCGVHYPSDIVVGALIAILSVYIIFKNYGLLEPLMAFVIKLGYRLNLA